MSEDDWFQARLRALARVKKLVALASGNQNQNEAEQAMIAARKLADEHGIDVQTLEFVSTGKKKPLPNWGGIMGAIRTAYPGEDKEDYSKYAEEQAERRREKRSREQEDDNEDSY